MASSLLGFGETGRRRSAAMAKLHEEKRKLREVQEMIFTNHESLPSLETSCAEFTQACPNYYSPLLDHIRFTEYKHLRENNQVCLDYTGYGLFSNLQLESNRSSTSFELAYISSDLPSHALYGLAEEGTKEADIRRSVMSFLSLQEDEYRMVFTAGRGAAFRLLAESYPFAKGKQLLTVYDHESEAVGWMEDVARKKGAEIMKAKFRYPSLRLCSNELKKQIAKKMKKQQNRADDVKENRKGLFVFPLQSRVSGSRYSYRWMSHAKDNNWHVLVDASTLGPHDTVSLGFSMFLPDFIIAPFYKVFGLDAMGFACLFIKNTAIQSLQSSSSARGIGMVRIVSPLPTKLISQNSSPDRHREDVKSLNKEEIKPFSASNHIDGIYRFIECSSVYHAQELYYENKEEELEEEGSSYREVITKKGVKSKNKEEMELFSASIDINRRNSFIDFSVVNENKEEEEEEEEGEEEGSSYREVITRKEPEAHCKCLDHAQIVGFGKSKKRTRCLVNWLIGSMLKLCHPSHADNNIALVQIYGPHILKNERGASIAFNLFDWKGVVLNPALVQRLGDRSNITMGTSCLQNICLPKTSPYWASPMVNSKGGDCIIQVLTVALNFLTNYEDVYRLWAFLARFLDVDYVSKEIWQYRALNQEKVFVG